MIFRALSIPKPYGEYISTGRKTIEVRQWRPDDILPITNLVIVENTIRLSSTGTTYDPDGHIIALADITDIRNREETDLEASFSGSFQEGWLAWELGNIRKAAYPFRVPAQLRIYDIELDSDLHEIKNTE